MKRLFVLLLPLLIIWGGGTRLKVKAETLSSHNATECTHINSYTCPGKNGLSTCPFSYITDPHIIENNHLYTTRINQYEECAACDGDYYRRAYFCEGCGGYALSYSGPCGCRDSDWHYSYVDQVRHKATAKCCVHSKIDSHLQTDYESCSSTFPCQMGHTVLSTMQHYYCTEHSYLGTDSTCPGLTVNPQPASLSLFYGQSETIIANQQPTTATVTYNSSDIDILAVSDTGTCSTNGVGFANVEVTATL